MPIDIPEALANKLKANSALYGAVLQTLTEFEPWFANSGTPFFPEYTDHGPKHVAETIATASSLIRDDAWPIVTATDAGILVLAILLHDSAMHLSEDGFLSLIRFEPVDRALEGWMAVPWPDLWLGFLGEASRFDARKLTALFGDTEPAKNPKDDPRDWTLRDRLLIGEFLRRHHPRLAHETAIYGVPGPGNPKLGLKGVESDFAELAGLVARSHGMPVRDALPHLRPYDVREYKGIHAPFLMAVLRVADYLQVHSARAPSEVLRVRKLRSPISQREWSAHAAIRDIRNTHEDPEAIFIDASPDDARTFLRLKSLLEGIQSELDASWAVLGEVYGRFKALDQLGLNLRRVRSNIDDIEEFAKKVLYLPYHAAFNSAGSDLLKLLIGPLYGEHPEIGIRELLQNSVDACRELKDYLEEHFSSSTETLKQETSVTVSLIDKGKDGRWIEVADSGIGMTADVVRGYFLRAGASFRKSDAWRQIHEVAPNKSRVLRSGRFGIGVLAAFLLGNEIEVSTRHVSAPEDRGLKFVATIDTDEIELRYCSRPVGTTVRVLTSDDRTWNALYDAGPSPQGRSWDWYCLTEPAVVRQQSAHTSEKSKLSQQFVLPSAKSSLPADWRRITPPNYLDVHWSYHAGPFLACNGIRVKESQDYAYRGNEPLGKNGHVGLMRPNVSVFDPDGYLPLVLQRNALATNKYPFDAELFEDVLRDWLAFLLVSAPTYPKQVDWYKGATRANWWTDWPGGLTPWCFTANGSLFPDQWHIHKYGCRRIVFLGHMFPHESLAAMVSPNLIVVPVSVVGGSQIYRQWIRSLLCGQQDPLLGHLMNFSVDCRRMVISKGELKLINRGRIIAEYLWSPVRLESESTHHSVLRTGDCNWKLGTDFSKLIADIGDHPAPILSEWHLAEEQEEPSDLTPMTKLWREILGDEPVIPYDRTERKVKFARGYAELKDYIAAHEELAAKKLRIEKDDKEGQAKLLPTP